MGTRSLICVYFNGRFVVAQYSQLDGYPYRDGEGIKVWRFLLQPNNIERLKRGLQHIQIFHTMEELRNLPDAAALHLQPSLSRDTGAGILEIIADASKKNHVPILLNLDFVNDGLYCEWVYVIDLDDAEFEVYRGLEGTVSKADSSTKRFNNVGGQSNTVPTLVKSFRIQALPDTEETFVGMLNEAMGNGNDNSMTLESENR